jgi:hypothetical protein
VIRRLLTSCAIALALAAAVAAQQRTPDDPDIVKIRLQVKNFETALKNALEDAGQAVTAEAQKVYPGAVLAWTSDPVVRGWPLPSFGYVFDVEVPAILPVSLLPFSAFGNQAPQPPPPSATGQAGPTQVATVPAKPGVSATNLPNPDPMRNTPVRFDPIPFYSDKVRDALIETILESSKNLPVRESDWLTVTAAPAELAIPNPLEPRKRRIILQITGANLAIYHRDATRKDAVRQLIVETRY